MAETYESSLQQGGTPVLDSQMMFELAMHRWESGQIEASRQMLNKLVEEGTEPWRRKSQIQMAQFDLVQGDHEQCLSRCLKLIQTVPSEHAKNDVLEIMGRVYQSQADHYNAALCFAGLIPGATANPDAGSLE